MRPRKPSLVVLANEHVRIEQACRWAGVDVPDIDTGGSMKVYCPFGELYHPDGGAEAAMRVYPGSNTCWCFACGEHFTPVRICAVAWHSSYQEVAVELLQRVDYKPVTYAQHWRQVTGPESDPGRQDAALALTVWAARQPGWERLQYEPSVAAYMGRCLGLLEVVRTAADCQEWLEGSKRVIRKACERAVPDGAV